MGEIIISGKQNRILCILPAYNEEGKIGRVVSKVTATNQVDKILVVDDCSNDSTRAEAEKEGATVLSHEHNMGVGAAIRTGLTYGCQNNYDIAVIMSGDDQHEPKELPVVLTPLIENKADFVQGSRRMKGGKTVNGPLFREVTTRLFSLVFTVITWRKITDGTNGFRAFRLSMLEEDEINIHQEWLNSYELEPYLLYRAVQSEKLRVVEVPITVYYHGTTAQHSKMRPIRDWWRLTRPLLFLRLGLKR